ncbi:hypothetical protein [Ferruginibacter profundus]
MFAFNGINSATNTFTPLALQDYKEAVTYNPNGNILTQTEIRLYGSSW